jgi:hypothetical protein
MQLVVTRPQELGAQKPALVWVLVWELHFQMHLVME